MGPLGSACFAGKGVPPLGQAFFASPQFPVVHRKGEWMDGDAMEDLPGSVVTVGGVEPD